MKRHSIRFALLFFASCASAAFAQEDSRIREELDTQYRKLAEAHDRKDTNAIAALKTADDAPDSTATGEK
jgi:hypothetical protein